MASEIVNAPAAPVLDADATAALLRLARAAVVAAIHGRPAPVVDRASRPPVLLEPAAAFVTLHERDELRGCLGNLEFDRPLWKNVLIAGAIVPLEDPRFLPVVESELPKIRIEVSVLAPPVALPGHEAFDARSQGIIVERSGRRARGSSDSGVTSCPPRCARTCARRARSGCSRPGPSWTTGSSISRRSQRSRCPAGRAFRSSRLDRTGRRSGAWTARIVRPLPPFVAMLRVVASLLEQTVRLPSGSGSENRGPA